MLSRILSSDGPGRHTAKVRTTATWVPGIVADQPSAVTARATGSAVRAFGSSPSCEAGTANENGTATPGATGVLIGCSRRTIPR
jgi:hypothetical protein